MINDAFENILDNLYSEIETEAIVNISVMNEMMKMEGLNNESS